MFSLGTIKTTRTEKNVRHRPKRVHRVTHLSIKQKWADRIGSHGLRDPIGRPRGRSGSDAAFPRSLAFEDPIAVPVVQTVWTTGLGKQPLSSEPVDLTVREPLASPATVPHHPKVVSDLDGLCQDDEIDHVGAIVRVLHQLVETLDLVLTAVAVGDERLLRERREVLDRARGHRIIRCIDSRDSRWPHRSSVATDPPSLDSRERQHLGPERSRKAPKDYCFFIFPCQGLWIRLFIGSRADLEGDGTSRGDL